MLHLTMPSVFHLVTLEFEDSKLISGLIQTVNDRAKNIDVYLKYKLSPGEQLTSISFKYGNKVFAIWKKGYGVVVNPRADSRPKENVNMTVDETTGVSRFRFKQVLHEKENGHTYSCEISINGKTIVGKIILKVISKFFLIVQFCSSIFLVIHVFKSVEWTQL